LATGGCSGFVKCNLAIVRESTVKTVGKPDALIGHVRFDERRWETGRRVASVLAPIVDSTTIGVSSAGPLG
jgi:hypothetical protein